MKTVFFGPFIGEFGWEYLYWHAWVNKVCKSEYKDYRKIIASYPGRESFYLYADEYWAHPQEYLDVFQSCNGYITDYWNNGFPRPNASVTKKLLGFLPYESWEFSEKNDGQICIQDKAEDLLDIYKDRLPSDTVFYTPFKNCSFNGFDFGVKQNVSPSSDSEITQTPIPFSKQDFELLKPSAVAKKAISDYLDPEDHIIAIYPRNRIQRRPDKNWSKDNYLEVVAYLEESFPEYKIGIFGAPGQAYFDDGVPSGLIDFINVPDNQRMNLQIAALQQAHVAIGSLSGAMLVARSAGVPTLSWGLDRDGGRFHSENRSKVETIFHPIQRPKPADIIKLCASILSKENCYDLGYENWSSLEYLKSGNGNKQRIYKKILNRCIGVLYAKNKEYE